MKLRQKLDEYRGHDVAVVMVDGRCFKGTLSDFDERILLLTNVHETTNAEIDWVVKESMAGVENPRIEWRKLALPEAVIMLDHVLRIWPWRSELDATKADAKTRQVVSGQDNTLVYRLF